MKVDLRSLVPNSSGFIIKIENGSYGENLEFSTGQDVKPGDIFLYAMPYECDVLIEITKNGCKVLCEDNGTDKNTFNYIQSLRK